MQQLELIVDTYQLSYCSVAGSDELDEPLNDALGMAGLGRVTGGMGGSGRWVTEIEIRDGAVPKALNVIRETLRGLNLPPSTVIRDVATGAEHRLLERPAK